MLKDENGNWCNDHDTLKLHVTQYYKRLFACPQGWCEWKQSHISFPRLSLEELAPLKDDISETEVKSFLHEAMESSWA